MIMFLNRLLLLIICVFSWFFGRVFDVISCWLFHGFEFIILCYLIHTLFWVKRITDAFLKVDETGKAEIWTRLSEFIFRTDNCYTITWCGTNCRRNKGKFLIILPNALSPDIKYHFKDISIFRVPSFESFNEYLIFSPTVVPCENIHFKDINNNLNYWFHIEILYSFFYTLRNILNKHF